MTCHGWVTNLVCNSKQSVTKLPLNPEGHLDGGFTVVKWSDVHGCCNWQFENIPHLLYFLRSVLAVVIWLQTGDVYTGLSSWHTLMPEGSSCLQ